MSDGDYATDRYAKVNIALSALVMGSVMVYEISEGHLTIWRTIRAFCIPAVCIWIPDIVEGLNSDLLDAKVIRIAGWVLLVFLVAYPYVLRGLFSWNN